MYTSSSNGSMNKEAARQFLMKGKKRLDNRDYISASHLLKKAKRLDPSMVPEVNSLLALIPKSSNPSRPHSTPPSSTRKKKTPRKRKESEEKKPEEKNYSEEDEKHVKSALGKKKDYYEILGITKESTQKQIKKAYRKKAMKTHPDRNKHPLSTEAFKKIGEAFVCLSDPQKRDFYDKHGIDPENKTQMHEQNESMFSHGGGHPRFMYGGNQDEDFFIHLFSQMFSGGDFEDLIQFQTGRGFRVHTRRNRRRRAHRPGGVHFVEQNEVLENVIRRLVTFIVMIFMFVFIFSWVSKVILPPGGGSGRNPYVSQYQKYYRFEKNHMFSRRMICQYHNDIEYYVTRDFQMSWKSKIDQVVYKDYRSRLMEECKKEQDLYQNALKRLKRERRVSKRKEIREQVERLKEVPSCKRHESIFNSKRS